MKNEILIKLYYYCQKRFPEPSLLMTKKRFEKRSIEWYAIDIFFNKCLNSYKNPKDILDDFIFSYEVMFSMAEKNSFKYLSTIMINTFKTIYYYLNKIGGSSDEY